MITRLLSLIIATIVVAVGQTDSAFAQGTAFTYQGRLTAQGVTTSGLYDFRLGLFNASSGGVLIGSYQTNSGIAISNGLFSTLVDFGNPFSGSSLWLDLGVRTNGGASFTTLSPRQLITATPYAITAANLTGQLPAGQLSGTLPSSALSGTYSGAIQFNNAANTYRGDGSALSGIVPAGTPTNHFLFAYATTTQTAVGSFTTIAFTTVAMASGWTMGSGGYTFTAPAGGLYLVQYDAQVATSSSNFTMSMRATLNSSTEILGSQAAAMLASSSEKVVLSKSFLFQAATGDTLSLQYAGSSSGFGSIAPLGQGTVRPSVSLTIIRIR